MADTAPKRPDIFAGPPCETCGEQTRIIGIDRHRRRKRAHVWTFECRECGAVDSVDMPIPQRPH